VGPEPGAPSCEDCGFRWSMSSDEAILLVEAAPDRYSAILGNGAGSRSDDPNHWSATGYLWHVVDVIRLGTERLWTLSLDAGSGVPGWDEEALAEARRYEQLSAVVGLRALDVAVRDWVRAAHETPPSAEVAHPVFGGVSTHHAIVRNAHEIQHHARDIEQAIDRRPPAGVGGP
jgi:hypothetical protein